MISLVYGGSASGKSALAETLACSLGGPLWYLATMEPVGKEGRARVKNHRAARCGKGFTTLECYRDLHALALPLPGGTVLLECMGNLCANQMFGGARYEEEVAEILKKGITALEGQADHLVVVSNDIFGDGVEYPPETRAYMEQLALVNHWLAQRAVLVAEAVCGLPLLHKGVLPGQM